MGIHIRFRTVQQLGISIGWKCCRGLHRRILVINHLYLSLPMMQRYCVSSYILAFLFIVFVGWKKMLEGESLASLVVLNIKYLLVRTSLTPGIVFWSNRCRNWDLGVEFG